MGYQGSKIYDIITTFMTSEVFMVNVYSTVTDTIGKEFPSLAYNYYRYDNHGRCHNRVSPYLCVL